MWRHLLVLLWLPGLGTPQKLVQMPLSPLPDQSSCPSLLPRVLPSLPLGGQDNSTMEYLLFPASTLTDCVQHCCSSPSCHAALLHTKEGSNDTVCWAVACKEDRLCLPSGSDPGASLVLVRPQHPPWTLPSPPSPSPTPPALRACEVGAETCRTGEVCAKVHDKSRNGVCRCKPGYRPHPQTDTCSAVTAAPTPPPAIPISVAVSSKSVQLPEHSATLTAYTVPEQNPAHPFTYEWKLISSPSSEHSSAVEEGAKTQSLKLSHLAEGVYVWKVTVISADPAGYGETRANVTVLAARRINSPPVAVIVPTQQTVTLPTNKAVVDGSGSTDDSGALASYSWVVDSGPVGYQPDLPNRPTLSLTNLTAGNYTIRLTVTDKDGAKDTTTADLMVVPDTDYKPKANAGEDKIIFLPTNTVVLNGNMSSDDHSVKSWEWTKEKGADGKELPADISGARSAYMTASNLEQGTYNFVLRVTDEKGQWDEDKVAVYVKPPTNLPPVARAGPDQTLSLPLQFVTLDGSKSTDDGHITSYLWTLESQPATTKLPHFSNASDAVTNVTNVTVGKYLFRLTVTDNSGNNHSDTTSLTVQHDTNLPPKSTPGKPVKVTLPRDTVLLDGSGSSDDLGVERWLWRRGPASPAAGYVVGGNMTRPSIQLTDLVPGIYTFSLTVWDKSDEKDSKDVKVIVLPDPDINTEVEILLNKNMGHLTEKDKDEVLKRVEVMTRGAGTLSVGHVSVVGDLLTQRATIRLKVFSEVGDKTRPLAGTDVVAQLRRELAADPQLLSQPVTAVRTRVCQNSCGGHGTCDQASRRCVCQPAWMEDMAASYLGGEDSNCDWSVVYVCLIVAAIITSVVLLCCFLSCRRSGGSSPRQPPRRYSRLQTSEQGLELQGDSSSLVHSDTDSEEEIVFQSAKKGRRLNGSLPHPAALSPRSNGKPGYKMMT